jgi:LacI family transcriptional regulator
MVDSTPDAPRRAVTLRDVARRAGVDVSTASRALSGRRRVTAGVAGRVHDAAESLGFSPNYAARSLRLSRTMTLGIVFGQLTSPGLLEFLEGLGSRADEDGYSLMVTVARGGAERYRTLVQRLCERRVDGLFIAAPPELGDALRGLQQAGTPVVALFRHGPGGDDLPLVTASEEEAVRQALRRLRELGHRRLLYLGIPAAIPSVRLEWLKEAAVGLGLALDARVIGHEESVTRLEARLREALGETAATALFFEYSEAPRLLGALRGLDLRIPQDLSLVVFGESTWTIELGPPLASIRHDLQALGRIAAQMMIERLACGPDAELPSVVEAGVGEWVERASIGPAPATTRHERR